MIATPLFTAAAVALGSLLAIVVGVVAHELTHLLAIRLLGGESRLSMSGLNVFVDFILPAGTSQLGWFFVGLAPFVCGIVIGLIALSSGTYPTTLDVWWVAPIAGWLVYTIPSGQDIRPFETG